MRKVILFNMVTLDGFFAGPNGELNWHTVDEEFFKFSEEQLNSADTLLFGRVTYQLMESYWTLPDVIKNDRVIAEKMNSYRKFVFSRTLERADWNNTTLIKENAAKEIAQLRQQEGKNILLLGSADLASGLIHPGLIDEFRLLISPVVLGNGRPQFKKDAGKLSLQLLKTREFRSGNVLLCYRLVSH